MDRIDCLRAFVRVMESGSFSAAAHELGVGQPAISKRVALLEGEFATQLFLRSTRKLKPTAEAHRVYDLARQLLHHFEQARSITDAAPQPSGTLRLSVPSSFGRRYIMPMVADYLRKYPQVRVDIRFNDHLIDFIEQGVELALHLGSLAASSFVARRICEEFVMAGLVPAIHLSVLTLHLRRGYPRHRRANGSGPKWPAR